jgi:ABC-type antimicrobial peptide transport system permease subunit
MTNENHVSPGFFSLLGISLTAGRDFDDRDTMASPRVAIVNEAFAAQILRTQRALGRTFRLQVSPGEADPVYQVVGVVANTKYSDVREPIGPIAYFPEGQDANPDPILAQVQALIRSRLPTGRLTAALTSAIREVHPSMLVSYRRLGDDIRRSFLRERLMALLSGFFGALAALLAVMGVYGVMSFIVARRRTEIGVRIALGAGRSDVVRMVMRDASLTVAAGLIVGVALALAVTRTAATLLFGVAPGDPASLAMAAAGLSAVAAIAGCVPAIRAARVEATVALRGE